MSGVRLPEMDSFAHLQAEWRALTSRAVTAERHRVGGWKERFSELRAAQQRLVEQGRWTRGQADLLGVLRLQYDEVRHCRVVRWLLDPLAPHGIGTGFLSGFLKDALNADSFAGLGRARVDVEETKLVELDGAVWETRAAIVIRGDNWTVLVEAKVNAAAGVRQAERLLLGWSEEPDVRFVLLSRG